MNSSATYIYSQRNIYDLTTFIEALRFLVLNFILFLTLLFLIIEEAEWLVFSFREKSNDLLVDNTSWNFKTIF